MNHGRQAAVFDSEAAADRTRLAVAMSLTAAYAAAEVIGALLGNSLALLADAGHMFSDSAALALSLLAAYLSGRPPTRQRTYGYHRLEILAALLNGSALLAVSLYLLTEAYGRLRHPEPVKSGLVLAIAAGGLAINLINLFILRGGKSGNLNIRGAWLHVLADALGSIGVIASALLIWTLGWNWADPLASALIALLIVYSCLPMLREAVAIVMEGTPAGLDADRVRDSIVGTGGVVGLHDLHIWSITTGRICFSAHVVVKADCDQQTVLARLRDLLRDEFAIRHATIQIEKQDSDNKSLQRDCPDCRS